MKALSIRQPWVWAILYKGKDVENRMWSTHYRGPLLLHAAQKLSNSYMGTYPDDIIRGGIVGIVDLVDVVSHHDSPWYKQDHIAWVLKNPRVIPFMKCRGYPGLFDVDYPKNFLTMNT